MSAVRPSKPKALGLLAAAASIAAGPAVAFAAVSPVGASSPSPGTHFSTATVPKLGKVVVDGRGRTVYILTANGKTNVSCTDGTGCTKIWPDLPLPKGTKSATESGLTHSKLGTRKLSDGETYPTYNGWLMYEYIGDSKGGQANGQGIKSFGGTWYVLSPSGNPIKMTTSAKSSSSSGGSSGANGSSGSSGSTTRSSSSGGYGY